MHNNNEGGREKEKNDTIPDILSLIDDAYETLQGQKTSGAPKTIKEKVMDQLLIIHEKVEKMARALQKDAANDIDVANTPTNKPITQEYTTGSSPAVNVPTTAPAKPDNDITTIQRQIDILTRDIAEIKAAVQGTTK